MRDTGSSFVRLAGRVTLHFAQERIQRATDLESCHTHFRLRGVIQAEDALPDFGHGITFEPQGQALAQGAGIAGKISNSFRARLRPADEAEQAATPRTGLFRVQ